MSPIYTAHFFIKASVQLDTDKAFEIPRPRKPTPIPYNKTYYFNKQ